MIDGYSSIVFWQAGCSSNLAMDKKATIMPLSGSLFRRILTRSGVFLANIESAAYRFERKKSEISRTPPERSMSAWSSRALDHP